MTKKTDPAPKPERASLRSEVREVLEAAAELFRQSAAIGNGPGHPAWRGWMRKREKVLSDINKLRERL